ncbi:Electron transfer flavoprotein alpha subunit (plasmid) [Rhizobium leguminosarum bv. trifolii WSM2304]|uniref:Electron transfer flavoprotein alpha subunit n=1 Tax=Rhizobium leguminosarum bv. trifolii (strain WSM2304) TaxID=395492 RepID=A0ABF7QZT1_RHILW|nr:electron transfer flavoprotein subunit alpha/FixB family protein [Rhizobium leguminosarum]ACI59661.1 Electron transfer flavoprotein alpha subunit [Rhizobium leguminosarum bv. trifolii WSM2304]
MKIALFVLHSSPETRVSEFATVAAIAEKLGDAGYKSELVVTTLSGETEVTIPYGSVFQKITAFSPNTPVGDGADFILQMASKAASDANASIIIGLGTLANRNWGPQLAASLEAEFVTSCEGLSIEGSSLAVAAPAMGGMVSKNLTLGDRPSVLLYSGDNLGPPQANGLTVPAAKQDIDDSGVRFISSEALPDGGGLPLRGASKVVSGGLGVGSAEKWRMIEEFAAKVDAAVGASRAAVEMGWVPSSRQVGFSGQKVSPDIYVAVGISGAVHHLAGIGGAKKIVAINKDPDAAIFKIADVGIVGDYEQILATAIQKLG